MQESQLSSLLMDASLAPPQDTPVGSMTMHHLCCIPQLDGQTTQLNIVSFASKC